MSENEWTLIIGVPGRQVIISIAATGAFVYEDRITEGTGHGTFTITAEEAAAHTDPDIDLDAIPRPKL